MNQAKTYLVELRREGTLWVLYQNGVCQKQCWLDDQNWQAMSVFRKLVETMFDKENRYRNALRQNPLSWDSFVSHTHVQEAA